MSQATVRVDAPFRTAAPSRRGGLESVRRATVRWFQGIAERRAMWRSLSKNPADVGRSTGCRV